MTNLLIKLFIKDQNVEKPETRAKYGMLSSITGIVVNILLSAVKLIIEQPAQSSSVVSARRRRGQCQDRRRSPRVLHH